MAKNGKKQANKMWGGHYEQGPAAIMGEINASIEVDKRNPDAADTLRLSLAAMAGMVRDMEPQPEKLSAALEEGFITATDLADWLMREADIPFRDAHHITGRIVRLAETRKCRLDQLSLADMQSIDKCITKDIFAILSPGKAIESRKSFGGTAPNMVKQAVKSARKKFL